MDSDAAGSAAASVTVTGVPIFMVLLTLVPRRVEMFVIALFLLLFQS